MPAATTSTTGTAIRIRPISNPASTPPVNPPSTTRSIRGGTKYVVPSGSPFRYVAEKPPTNQATIAAGTDHR